MLDLNVYWIGAVLGLLALLAIAVTMPYAVFREAWANTTDPDGTRHGPRLRTELSALANFFGELLLVPVLVFGITGGATFFVHEYVIPIPLVADVMSMFDPDMTVWDERMETGRLGDVGRIYGRWSEDQGFSPTRGYVVRKFLKRNWLALLIVAAGLTAFFYWFATRYYISTVVAYHEGVQHRRQHYRQEDGHRRTFSSFFDRG